MNKQIISNKKKVLIVNPFFLPGYRSGGPQQTVKSICDVYSKRSEIYLLTLNHDLGIAEPYDLPTGVWLIRNIVLEPLWKHIKNLIRYMLVDCFA